MKKLLLLAILLGTAVSALAQGSVSFRNNASTSFYFRTNNFAGTVGLMSGTNAYRIGLYATPGTISTSNSLTLVGLATNSAALPGRFLGPSPYVLPAGYAPGTPITFQIRAWTFSSGMSYEEALLNVSNGSVNPFDLWVGASDLGTVTPSDAASPVALLFGAAPLVSGFEIHPYIIPEPSSIALGVLGLGAMALFRRRTSK